MRKHIVILGIILFICLPSSAQVDTTAVIAGWNLKGFTAIPDDRIGRLAQAIVDIDAEVVALSEVNPDGAVDKLILELSRLGAGYQGQLLDQTANLNVAILYKAGVFVGNVGLVDGSDDGNSGCGRLSQRMSGSASSTSRYSSCISSPVGAAAAAQPVHDRTKCWRPSSRRPRQATRRTCWCWATTT